MTRNHVLRIGSSRSLDAAAGELAGFFDFDDAMVCTPSWD
jgi:hypothetical protein